MSFIQILFLVIGVFFVITSIDFSKIKNFFISIKIPKIFTSNSEYKPDNFDIDIPAEPTEYAPDLIDVVKKWSNFKDVCLELGLKEAVDKLDEIFPILIKVEKNTKE